MSAINELHDAAMDFAHFALLERARGNTEEASTLFEKALENEIGAIQDMEERGSFSDLTYAVLHRSAGTLALDCKKYRLAEQLAAKGLARAEHSEVAEELRDLLEQVNFHRHLELKGVELGDGEMQMSLSGPVVGSGTALLSDFKRIVDNVETFIYCTIEWMMDRPFREKGSPPKDIKDNYLAFTSVPRPGSFAVSLKISRPIHQPSFPGMSGTSEIVNEFMDMMELVNSSTIPEMEKRVRDPAYMRKFLELAKKIAPDGERIRQVGFTAVHHGNTRLVSITKPASEISIPCTMPHIEEPSDSATVKISGVLQYADAVGKNNQIRVVDENDQYRVEVPTGMMNDIVRPMWDSKVTVTGARKGTAIVLQDIRKAEDVEQEPMKAWADAMPLPGIE